MISTSHFENDIEYTLILLSEPR